MAAKQFIPTEYPEDPAGQALAKADALACVLQSYLTSNRWQEAPVLDHRLHWYLEALGDEITTARRYAEEASERSRLRSVAGGSHGG